MRISQLVTKVTAAAGTAALAAGLLVGATGTTASAALPPRAATACSGAYSCTISISLSSQSSKLEGQSIAGQVQFRPNHTTSLRAFEGLYSSTGEIIGLRYAGPAFSVTTNGSGYASFNAPTYKIAAPSLGGEQFLIQTSDFTYAHYKAGQGIGTPSSKWPNFILNSARGRLWQTTSTERYRQYDYHTSTIRYAIPGHRYQMQAQSGGRWYNLNDTAAANNGVIRQSSISYHSGLVFWSIPNTWGTGVYPTRLLNTTTGAVLHTSSYAIYGPPTGVWGDQDGDRTADVLGVDSAGTMRTYLTRSGPKLSSGFYVGGGWSSMNWVSTLPDMDGNKRSEMVARRSDGTLWLYRGQDLGKFGSATKIGSGWQGMTALAIIPDIDRDGAPELLARTKDGKLLRYRITTAGAKYANQVGTGWTGISKMLSVGDLTRDGVSDIVGIHRDGTLLRYALNSRGQVTSTAVVGRGWSGMNMALSPGDMDKDGRRDMIGRRADGTLWFYHNYGNGKFGSAKMIGRGWQGFRLIT